MSKKLPAFGEHVSIKSAKLSQIINFETFS